MRYLYKIEKNQLNYNQIQDNTWSKIKIILLQIDNKAKINHLPHNKIHNTMNKK